MFLCFYVDALEECHRHHGVVVVNHHNEVFSVEGESHQMRESPADVEKMISVQEHEGVPNIPST